MIIYITGAPGVGKTTILNKLPIKGYDLDDIFEDNLKKHRKHETIVKGVEKDIQELEKKHKNIVIVGFLDNPNLPFKPDRVYILVRKDYEAYYRDKAVRDLYRMCKYAKENEKLLRTVPIKDFGTLFPYNELVGKISTLEEFKKNKEAITNFLHSDYPTAEILTANEILKKIQKLL